MTRLRADVLLLLCAMVWGLAFVAQKQASATVGPILFVSARFALSAALIAPLALFERSRRQLHPFGPGAFWLALAIGLCVCVGSTMQQWALGSTTATNGGFLTAIYVVFVPLVVWLTARRQPRVSVIVACGMSICGAWLLAQRGQASNWNKGDLILLASDVVWALHITLVSRFMAAVDRPFLLCFIQAAVTAVVAAVLGVVTEASTLHALAAALPSLLYAGLVSGGIGFTLQIIAQRHTPAAEAALIMSLESVFAAIGGALVFHERLRPAAWVGCGLILLGVLMVELLPTFRRSTARSPSS
jgi:drug/metabolite transporter (DMT)-like permease